MPLMTLSKNRVFATTLGHVIRFIKDEPVNVPPIAVRACEAIGANFVDGEKPVDHVNEDELADQVAASINAAKNAEGIAVESAKKPEISPDRIGDVVKAIHVINDRNDRDDFTAAGKINLNSLSREVGYRVDKSELTEAMNIINDPD